MNEAVGYTYRADLWCAGCMRAITAVKALNNGMSEASVRSHDLATLLDFWAYSQSIDRADETTFDTDVFPKPVHEVNDCQHCGQCGHVLDADLCTCVERCPACGEQIDYCRGHGMLTDPARYRALQSHDKGDHRLCAINCEVLA